MYHVTNEKRHSATSARAAVTKRGENAYPNEKLQFLHVKLHVETL